MVRATRPWYVGRLLGLPLCLTQSTYLQIILFMCTASMAAVTTIVLVIYDERYGGGVLASRHTGKSAKEEWEEEQRAREPINVHIQVHTD